MTALPPTPAHDAHCHTAHVRFSIDSVDDAMSGKHLRAQRELGGFSAKTLAEAMALSATRIRQLEDAPRVTPAATVRYLRGLGEAWRRRAEECSR